MITHALLIPNASPESDVLHVTSPWDGSAIADCETGGMMAVEAALANAHGVFQDHSRWLPAQERIAILSKTVEIMEGRAEELAINAAREGGKPLIDSRIEVARAIDGVRSCIEVLRTQRGEEIPMNLNAASAGRLAMTRHAPIGPVVAVSAFNHPLNLIIHQVAPAVAVGCPVIIKPAGDTPLSCIAFVKILHEAGLPKEWAQVFISKNRAAATALVTDPRVAFFSFIGSASVGWTLKSQLSPGTRCALEHGGAAPAIVTEDADLEAAVPLLSKGGLYHAGQVCVSVQRIFAHKSIAKKLAQSLAEAAQKMPIGDPVKEETEIGPLIRPKETNRIAEWVEEAKAGGAEVLCGGQRFSENPQHAFENTILYNPSATAKVSTQEIFGPVICVYPYENIDDAITQANAVPYSFQACVFSSNINTALDCYEKLNASAIMINDHSAFRVDWMPFAGLKKSGYGTGGIPYTMEDMQVKKMLVIKS